MGIFYRRRITYDIGDSCPTKMVVVRASPSPCRRMKARAEIASQVATAGLRLAECIAAAAVAEGRRRYMETGCPVTMLMPTNDTPPPPPQHGFQQPPNPRHQYDESHSHSRVRGSVAKYPGNTRTANAPAAQNKTAVVQNPNGDVLLGLENQPSVRDTWHTDPVQHAKGDVLAMDGPAPTQSTPYGTHGSAPPHPGSPPPSGRVLQSPKQPHNRQSSTRQRSPRTHPAGPPTFDAPTAPPVLPSASAGHSSRQPSGRQPSPRANPAGLPPSSFDASPDQPPVHSASTTPVTVAVRGRPAAAPPSPVRVPHRTPTPPTAPTTRYDTRAPLGRPPPPAETTTSHPRPRGGEPTTSFGARVPEPAREAVQNPNDVLRGWGEPAAQASQGPAASSSGNVLQAAAPHWAQDEERYQEGLFTLTKGRIHRSGDDRPRQASHPPAGPATPVQQAPVRAEAAPAPARPSEFTARPPRATADESAGVPTMVPDSNPVTMVRPMSPVAREPVRVVQRVPAPPGGAAAPPARQARRAVNRAPPPEPLQPAPSPPGVFEEGLPGQPAPAPRSTGPAQPVYMPGGMGPAGQRQPGPPATILPFAPTSRHNL